MNQSFFYLPENLDLIPVFEKYPWLKKEVHQDKLKYIIHLIYLRNILLRNEDNQEYIPLKCKYLQRIITTEFAASCKEALVSCGIIEQRKKGRKGYVIGLESKSYKLNEFYYNSTFRREGIYDNKLITRIRNWKAESENRSVNNHAGKQLLKKSIEEVDFDCSSALKAIQQKSYSSQNQKNHRNIFVDLFENKQHFFKQDSAGRCYHLFTSCPSDLRRFATWRNKNLWSVDVSNCQPTLHTLLYNSVNSSERSKFIEIVKNNRFYHFINDKLENPFDLNCNQQKSIFKQEIFRRIFYGDPNFQKGHEINRIFVSEFPILDSLIRKAKSGHKRDLPISLQKIESELVIDSVSMEFAQDNSDSCLISIHDSLITTKENISEVKERISKAFKLKLGFDITSTISEITI